MLPRGDTIADSRHRKVDKDTEVIIVVKGLDAT